MQIRNEIQEADYIIPDQPGGIPGWQEGIPVFRIYTCGLFTIEMLVEVPEGDPAQARYVELPPERFSGRGPGSAQKAVKILLSQEGRYATKDWLRTHLREGQEVCATNKRLENIISYLRCHLLCLPSGKKLKDLLTYRRGTEESGDGYQLAGYPLVWVDVEALAWYVKQACLKERFHEDPLPYWERAYTLASRGHFLIDEPTSEWATRQREMVDDQMRQCVHALAHLYLARYGQAGEEDALRILLPYCRMHPQDEDALRPLLELLNKRGRYQEVLEWHEQLEDALAEAGAGKTGAIRTPQPLTAEIADFARLKLREQDVNQSAHMKALAQECRSHPQKTVDEWKGEQEQQREHDTIQIVEVVKHARTVLNQLADLRKEEFASFPSPIAQGILEATSVSGRGTMDQLRRHLMQQLLGIAGALTGSPFIDMEPWERLSTVHIKPAALNDATFALFERLLEDCWELSNQNELEVAYGILSSFLPKILALPPSDVDSRIAYLASQGLRLQSVLVHHNSKPSEKVPLCQRSVEYARFAGNVNTLVAALMELAVAYKYNGQPDQWFKAFQEVLYYSPQASPLLQSQAYFKSALVFAYYKRRKEAELYLQMAFDAFPDHLERDPEYRLADASIYTFSRDAGRVYLELGQIHEAYSAFERYKQDAPGTQIPERIRLEVINGETRAAALEQHREKYISFLQEGLASALSLGSKRRFDEAYTIFREEMPASWLKDSDIQSIAEQYHLTRA